MASGENKDIPEMILSSHLRLTNKRSNFRSFIFSAALASRATFRCCNYFR